MKTLPHVRGSETSLNAAHLAVPKEPSQLERVRAHLVGCGPQGDTDEGMQDALKMNPSTQRPRRISLVDKGDAVDSGRKRNTRSGRPAVVWIMSIYKSDGTA